MNIEEVRDYCLAKRGVTEGLPFNDTALVFKVGGKMFALLDLSEEQRGITLKCDPERALELREHYAAVTPAWHFNKRHWNTIDLLDPTGSQMVKGLIDHAYGLVFESLPAKTRASL